MLSKGAAAPDIARSFQMTEATASRRNWLPAMAPPRSPARTLSAPSFMPLPGVLAGRSRGSGSHQAPTGDSRTHSASGHPGDSVGICGAIYESMVHALIDGLDRILTKLSGTTRGTRGDRMACIVFPVRGDPAPFGRWPSNTTPRWRRRRQSEFAVAAGLQADWTKAVRAFCWRGAPLSWLYAGQALGSQGSGVCRVFTWVAAVMSGIVVEGEACVPAAAVVVEVVDFELAV